MSFAVFENEQIFNEVKAQGILPSGTSLGMPVIDVYGRCACKDSYTYADEEYLRSFEGVTVNGLPDDWEMPPEEE